MAKNLRAKISKTDALIICDTNANATKRFVEEEGMAASNTAAPEKGAGIHIAENPREVAQKAVGLAYSLLFACKAFSDEPYSINDLSWGLLMFSLF